MSDFLSKSQQIYSLLKAAKDDESEVASIAVMDNGHILMGQRRDNGRFTMPGGHLDTGEEKTEGAVRELFEETGIKVSAKDLKYLGSESITTHSGKKKKIHAFSYQWEGERPTTKNDPDKEVFGWGWIDCTKGIPKEIAENSHTPVDKNITFKLLKLEVKKSFIPYENLKKIAPPDQEGQVADTHGYVAKLHPSGKVMWANGPERAAAHDKTINNPEIKNQFLSQFKTPFHRNMMHAVINMTAKDPNRHFIPSREGKEEVLRARHINSLLSGNKEGYIIDTSHPSKLSITIPERHGTLRRPTAYEFHAPTEKSEHDNLRNEQRRASEGSRGLRSVGNSNGRRDGLRENSLDDRGFTYAKIGHDSGSWQGSYLKHFRPKLEEQAKIKTLDPLDALLHHFISKGSFIHHPVRGIIANRRIIDRGDGSSLMKDEQKPVKLVHYSTQSGLKEINPKFQGTGAPSSENRRGLPEVRRSYFYVEGTQPEDIVTQGAKSKYKATLQPNHKIYDLSNDHEGHVDAAVSANHGAWNSDAILSRIRDAGYHGFTNSKSALPNVVALFHPHPVDHEESLRA